MRIETAVIHAVSLTLWGVYFLLYLLVFSSSWTATTPRLIGYTAICSSIGFGLCAAAWQFVLAPLVRRATVIDLLLATRVALVTVVVGASHAFVTVVLEPIVFGRSLGSFGAMMAMNFVSFFFIYCVVYCCGVLLDLLRRDADRRERLALAESRANHAQLLALRLQINPHFIFNALNAIASLIALDRNTDAIETVQRLSRFVRIVTETPPHEFSELRSELEMAEEYLDVEAVRFQERLRVVIEADPEMEDFQVPNFILQPLVENAVKHGVGRSLGQTDVIIRAQKRDGGLRLVVENSCTDHRPAEGKVQSLGIGLRNVAERLAALYGGQARMLAAATPTGYRVDLELPDPARTGGEG